MSEARAREALLEVRGLDKSYPSGSLGGRAVHALRGVSFSVDRGEIVALVGESGSGKSTIGRILLRLERADRGEVRFAGVALPVTRGGRGARAYRRQVQMVFQDPFASLNGVNTVRYHLERPLLQHGRATRRTLEREVARLLEAVGLGDGPDLLDRHPHELSGGQRQRVALARALAPEPPVLLLDEPLSNLDAALRERTRDELRTLLKRVGITAVFVTHDQEEAFALSDRIAILRDGRLQQLGTPEELYRYPANPFVAAFVGRANFLPGRLVESEGETGVAELSGGARWKVRLHGNGSGRVRVLVRPEALRLTPAGEAAPGEALAGRVIERRFSGAVTVYRVEVDGPQELLVTVGGHDAALEGAVAVTAEQSPPLHAFPDTPA
jgi:peptide/nickel transport system ATP-binding protein